jgi:hypothetical protein
MKLVSYFSEVRLIYYDFPKVKTFSGINKWLSKKEKQGGDTWQHRSVHVSMMTSSEPTADISIDQVNVDCWLVNRVIRVRKVSGSHRSASYQRLKDGARGSAAAPPADARGLGGGKCGGTTQNKLD